MMYVLVKDGAVAEYPYHFGSLRAAYPDNSFPRVPSTELLREYGVHEVVETARPDPSDAITQNVVEAAPALINKEWTQQWAEVDVPAEVVAERRSTAKDNAARLAVKGDIFVSTFVAMTPAQVTAYIEANVTNVDPSAKNVMEKLALMLLLLARREFR